MHKLGLCLRMKTASNTLSSRNLRARHKTVKHESSYTERHWLLDKRCFLIADPFSGLTFSPVIFLDNQDGDDRTEGETTTKGSAIKKHLLSSSQCRSVYDDSCFTVLCRARRFRELKVLEAVFIRKHNPN